MSFTPFAGTAGRVSHASIAPDLTLPLPATGTPSQSAFAGIRKWRLSVKLESGQVLNFESPASATGALWGVCIQGGVASWSVALEGEFDGDTTTTAAKLPIGGIVHLDLIFSKASTFGYQNCLGKVVGFDGGSDVKEQVSLFTAQIEGSGALPLPAVAA